MSNTSHISENPITDATKQWGHEPKAAWVYADHMAEQERRANREACRVNELWTALQSLIAVSDPQKAECIEAKKVLIRTEPD